MAKMDEQSRILSAQHEGENYFVKLTGKLIAESRLDDLKKATEDEEFRRKLYEEFGIKKA